MLKIAKTRKKLSVENAVIHLSFLFFFKLAFKGSHWCSHDNWFVILFLIYEFNSYHKSHCHCWLILWYPLSKFHSIVVGVLTISCIWPHKHIEYLNKNHLTKMICKLFSMSETTFKAIYRSWYRVDAILACPNSIIG